MFKKLLLALVTSVALMGSAWAAVDLNTANQQQLETLNGIGPEKAKDIIEYRNKNGAFKTPEDIMKVPGIKEGTYAKIKGDISVGGKVAAPAAAAKATAKPADAKASKEAKAAATTAPKATAEPKATKAPKATKEPKASAPAKK